MPTRRPSPGRVAAALTLPLVLLVSACGPTAADQTPTGTAAATSVSATVDLFDSSTVHEIAIAFDEADYDAMIATYASTGEKEWIEASVTIDGTTYERVGIRLKGNSSLRGLGRGGDAGAPGEGRGGFPGGAGDVTADDAASLPWLVDLDQFVDGQQHDGIAEFVVRSNSSSTALNEAVALELLERAGLASQDATAVRFTVNGGDAALRLVIENPDDDWMAEELASTGALYKAESTGDYSYRGDDPDAYDEVFDQEAGKDNADLTPLIGFLEFINEADDATFAAELEDRLDVESFATYLAMQELVSNFDDIDGPGNNSYLYYDPSSGRFTVVPWDYNLAFGAGIGGGGFRPGGDVQTPEGFQPPGGGQGAPGGGGFPSRSNVLVERFLAIEEYQALVEERTVELTSELVDSGIAADVLAEWVSVLEAQATDLVDVATIEADAERVAAQL